ncbi:MAG: hypothetical protein KC713_02850 [Candidatus Omnitrophica bacterium]|nr:hypothetical protein [Candidatus Omnitrophota bacterium]
MSKNVRKTRIANPDDPENGMSGPRTPAVGGASGLRYAPEMPKNVRKTRIANPDDLGIKNAWPTIRFGYKSKKINMRL